MADNTLIVNTLAQVDGQTAPAMSQSNRASYTSGQTINQTVVLRAGQQYAPNLGFTNLVVTTTGPIQLLAKKGSNPTYINQTINQQTTIDDTVDSFTITNNGTVSVTVKLIILVYVGNPLPSTGVVTSLDGMIGDLTLTAGSGVSVTDGAQQITIENTGVLTVNSQKGNVTVDANNLPGLSRVGQTGQYSDIIGTPSPYVLPVATQDVLGGIKIGAGLSITPEGVLSASGFPDKYVTSVSGQYGDVVVRASDNGASQSASLIVNDGSGTGNIVLNRLAVSGPSLTMLSQNGVIILGSKNSISTVDGQTPDLNGNITIQATSNTGVGESLIKDSGATTGNIVLNKLVAGRNVQITPDENGNLSINSLLNQYVLPVATASVLGGVKKGANVNIDADGTLSVAAPYVLPPATRSTLGGVAIGDNITVDANGLISVAAPYTLPIAKSNVLGGVKIGANINVSADGTISVATPYTLPVATATVLGGVKQGSNVQIAADGTISVAAPYVLPVATATTLGGVKQGSNVTIAADGTISATAYSLPIASASVLGGIRVGNNLSIDAQTGILSAVFTPYTLPPATTTTLGGVIVGDNLTVDASGKISAAAPYVLPAATGSSLGGVKVGSGLSVAADGTISWSVTSIPAATTTTLGLVKIGDNISVTADGTISVAPPYSLPTASSTVLGGVKVGANLAIDGNGVLSATNSYTLPIASASVLGGVKIGANVNVAGDGTISVAAPYSLPAATTSTLGGLIVGDNLTVDSNGRVSASFTLPTASSTTLGGIKVGTGLSIDGSGTLSLNYSSPVTSVNTKTGDVVIQAQSDNPKSGTISLVANNGANTGTMTFHDLVAGSGVTISPNSDGNLVVSSTSPVTSVSGQTGAVVIQAQDNNSSSGVSLIANSGASTGTIKLLRLVAGSNVTLSPDVNGNLQINGPATYTLPPATASVLGGVKIGANINVTADGTISVAAPTPAYTLPPATTSTLGGVIVGTGLTVDGTGKISVTPTSPPVTSVNGQTGAVVVSATNAVTGSTSLITDSGSTTGVMKFKQVKAGTNFSIVDDGAGTLTLNATTNAPVTSVNSQTGAVSITAADAISGNTSLITDNGATTGTMKFKQLKAGSNITIADDGAGTLTVTASATSGFGNVNNVAASRTYGTTYTVSATTFVCVTTQVLAQGIITAKVNGITVGSVAVPSGGPTLTMPLSFVVPAGGNYSVAMNNPAYGAGTSWIEIS